MSSKHLQRSFFVWALLLFGLCLITPVHHMADNIERRMEDRGFSEVELRRMLQDATSLAEDKVEGRWAVATRHNKVSWTVIVEPDRDVDLLVIATAFPIEVTS